MAWIELVSVLALVQYLAFGFLVAFLPALWLASRYWSPTWMAAIGAVYLVGRMLYRNSYVKDPASRGLGFMLTIAPTAVLLVATLVGLGLSVLRA
jgi:glutathione S-transferase